MALPKPVRKSMGDVFEKGAQCRQSLVTGLGCVASAFSQGIQELGYEVRIKIVKAKLYDSLLTVRRRELQQQSHRIRVTPNRVRSQTPLKFEVVVKKRG
jgi:hypothetical protein